MMKSLQMNPQSQIYGNIELRIYLRIIWILLISLVGGSSAFGQNGPDVRPYQLPLTEVCKRHSKIVSLDYVLYISLPRNYATSSEVYPAAFAASLLMS